MNLSPLGNYKPKQQRECHSTDTSQQIVISARSSYFFSENICWNVDKAEPSSLNIQSHIGPSDGWMRCKHMTNSNRSEAEGLLKNLAE